MEEEQPVTPHKRFISISSKIKQLLKERKHILQGNPIKKDEIIKNTRAVYHHLLQMKQTHRLSQEILETEAKIIEVEKSKLELLTNTNEGLLYQTSNIIRQIKNCENVPVANLTKIDRIQQHFQSLAQAKSKEEIQRLDDVIAEELKDELSKRKKLKVDLKQVETETTDVKQLLNKTNEKLIELPDFVSEIEEILRKGYETFTGIKVLSKDEMVLMKDLPQALSNIYHKFYNYNKGHKTDLKINIDEYDDDFKPKMSGLIDKSFIKIRFSLVSSDEINLNTDFIMEFAYHNTLQTILLKYYSDDQDVTIDPDVLFKLYSDTPISTIYPISEKMGTNEKILNENYVLIDWVQNLSNMNEVDSIGNLIEKIRSMIISSLSIEHQIEQLISKKSFTLNSQTFTLDNFEQISYKDSLKYIEIHKTVKKQLEETKEDQFLNNLTTLSQLNSMDKFHAKILSTGLSFFRASQVLKINKVEGAQYYKIELCSKPNKPYVIIMKVWTEQGKIKINFEITQRQLSIKKKKYKKSMVSFVRKVEKGKIYGYSKPYTITSLQLRNLELETENLKLNSSKEIFEKLSHIIVNMKSESKEHSF